MSNCPVEQHDLDFTGVQVFFSDSSYSAGLCVSRVDGHVLLGQPVALSPPVPALTFSRELRRGHCHRSFVKVDVEEDQPADQRFAGVVLVKHDPGETTCPVQGG